MKAFPAYIMGLVLGFIIGFTAHAAFAADLPQPRTMRVAPLPLPVHPLATPIAPAIPSPKAPQPCLENGKEPFPGQTLRADTSCPTGLRWKYQK